MRLIEEENLNVAPAEMIQQLTRFLMNQIALDSKRTSPEATQIKEVCLPLMPWPYVLRS